jgi:hypothetical protein
MKEIIAIVLAALVLISAMLITTNILLKSQINQYEEIFVLTEDANPKNVNAQKAFYHATLTNGNTLLESEDGNLWEFDNLDADENDAFVILFDENNNLLGLWQAA